MGIDFGTNPVVNFDNSSWGDWAPHWAYSGFHRFRHLLAEAEHIDLDRMEGFTEDGYPWDGCDSPLRPLLHHSDCDGEMTAEECAVVYPRLRQICESWTDIDRMHDKQNGLALAALMEAVANEDAELLFR